MALIDSWKKASFIDWEWWKTVADRSAKNWTIDRIKATQQNTPDTLATIINNLLKEKGSKNPERQKIELLKSKRVLNAVKEKFGAGGAIQQMNGLYKSLQRHSQVVIKKLLQSDIAFAASDPGKVIFSALVLNDLLTIEEQLSILTGLIALDPSKGLSAALGLFSSLPHTPESANKQATILTKLTDFQKEFFQSLKNPDQQARVLSAMTNMGDPSPTTRDTIFKSLPLKEKTKILASPLLTKDAGVTNDLFNLFTPDEKTELLVQASKTDRIAIFNKMSTKLQSSILETLPKESPLSDLFKTLPSPKEKADVLVTMGDDAVRNTFFNKLTSAQEKADTLFVMSDLDKKQMLFNGQSIEQQKAILAHLGKLRGKFLQTIDITLSPTTLKGLIIDNANGKEYFSELTAEQQNKVLTFITLQAANARTSEESIRLYLIAGLLLDKVDPARIDNSFLDVITPLFQNSDGSNAIPPDRCATLMATLNFAVVEKIFPILTQDQKEATLAHQSFFKKLFGFVFGRISENKATLFEKLTPIEKQVEFMNKLKEDHPNLAREYLEKFLTLHKDNPEIGKIVSPMFHGMDKDKCAAFIVKLKLESINKIFPALSPEQKAATLAHQSFFRKIMGFLAGRISEVKAVLFKDLKTKEKQDFIIGLQTKHPNLAREYTDQFIASKLTKKKFVKIVAPVLKGMPPKDCAESLSKLEPKKVEQLFQAKDVLTTAQKHATLEHQSFFRKLLGFLAGRISESKQKAFNTMPLKGQEQFIEQLKTKHPHLAKEYTELYLKNYSNPLDEKHDSAISQPVIASAPKTTVLSPPVSASSATSKVKSETPTTSSGESRSYSKK